MLISIVSFVVVFTIITLTHEGGHLLWAKKAGIRVIEFGIGFGPRLLSFTKNGTIYSVNLVPFLGFVRIAGEGENEEDKNCPPDELYQSKTPLQKFKTLIAGPLMNIFTALIILIVLFQFTGVPAGVSNEIEVVNKNSPAEKAGLKQGDKLLSINGQTFAKMEDAIDYIHKSAGQEMAIKVARNSQELTVKAKPVYNEKMKVALLGFAPKAIYQRVNPFSAGLHAIEQTASMVLFTVIILGRLFTGGLAMTDLAGPLGIAQITGKYAQSGLISLTYFTAFISVNVGVLNLLPLPALDGGRVVFVLIEWIRRKPVPAEIENKVNYWGMVALLALMALITVNDLLRILRSQ